MFIDKNFGIVVDDPSRTLITPPPNLKWLEDCKREVDIYFETGEIPLEKNTDIKPKKGVVTKPKKSFGEKMNSVWKSITEIFEPEERKLGNYER